MKAKNLTSKHSFLLQFCLTEWTAEQANESQHPPW